MFTPLACICSMVVCNITPFFPAKPSANFPVSRPRGQPTGPRVTSIMRVHISMASHITRTGDSLLGIRKRIVVRFQTPIDRRFISCTGFCVSCGRHGL
jgi:hypothetical protein